VSNLVFFAINTTTSLLVLCMIVIVSIFACDVITQCSMCVVLPGIVSHNTYTTRCSSATTESMLCNHFTAYTQTFIHSPPSYYVFSPPFQLQYLFSWFSHRNTLEMSTKHSNQHSYTKCNSHSRTPLTG